eukprot:2263247-Pyramimonas_sp.AAC.1
MAPSTEPFSLTPPSYRLLAVLRAPGRWRPPLPGARLARATPLAGCLRPRAGKPRFEGGLDAVWPWRRRWSP